MVMVLDGEKPFLSRAYGGKIDRERRSSAFLSEISALRNSLEKPADSWTDLVLLSKSPKMRWSPNERMRGHEVRGRGWWRRIAANQPNTPTLLPRRLLCEKPTLPAPAGSTLPTQGLRGDFAVTLLEAVPQVVHARLAQPLTSAVAPKPAQEQGNPSAGRAQLSPSEHSLPCPGWEPQAQPIPPSQLGSISLLVLTGSTNETLLLSHGMGILGSGPKDSQAEAVAVPPPSSTTGTLVTGSHGPESL